MIASSVSELFDLPLQSTCLSSHFSVEEVEGNREESSVALYHYSIRMGGYHELWLL